MKVLMTGARGRLGGVLRQFWEKRGNTVVAYSRNADEGHRSLADLNKELATRRPAKALLHLAWSTVPASAELRPGSEWREDLPLLASILEGLHQAKNKGIRIPRLVFFSTCAVYGQGKRKRAFSEKDPASPIGWYASAKAEAEALIRRFCEQNSLPYLILRISNPYGFVHNHDSLQGVIPHLSQSLLRRRPFRLWGDGRARKDYLHVEDFCQGVDAAIRHNLTGIYNLCHGRTTSLQELISLFAEITGKKFRTEKKPAKAWDVGQAWYTHAKFTRATGWRPSIILCEGLHRYLKELFSI